MPRYDYRCQHCATQFEAQHPMNAPSPACPQCSGATNKVYLSAPAMHDHNTQGREKAIRSLNTTAHGSGCHCCHAKT